MKLRVLLSQNVLIRKLRNKNAVLREAAATAVASALRTELQRNTSAAVSISATGTSLSVGSTDARDAEREFGSLTETPSPWLAPVLPLALEPMRAAATTRVREAAARAASAIGKRKR